MMPQHMDATKENSSPTVALPSLLIAIVFLKKKFDIFDKLSLLIMSNDII